VLISAIGIAQVTILPVQAPDQPAKTEFWPGVAVTVTTVFPGKAAVQVGPQLMPGKSLVTVPVPAPVFETIRLNETDGRGGRGGRAAI
jgi:hypothetical protein